MAIIHPALALLAGGVVVFTPVFDVVRQAAHIHPLAAAGSLDPAVPQHGCDGLGGAAEDLGRRGLGAGLAMLLHHGRVAVGDIRAQQPRQFLRRQADGRFDHPRLTAVYQLDPCHSDTPLAFHRLSV